MQAVLRKEIYFLVKDYIQRRYGARVSLRFIDDQSKVVGEDEKSWDKLENILQRTHRPGFKPGQKYTKTTAPDIKAVLETKRLRDGTFAALCRYEQRILSTHPLADCFYTDLDCEEEVQKKIGVFRWSEAPKAQRFELWEQSPDWENIVGEKYPIFSHIDLYQPLQRYLERCIECDDGETVITDTYPVKLLPQFQMTGYSQDGCWIVAVARR